MRRKKIDLPSLFWGNIKGYEGLYQASIDGDVKSLRTGKILRPGKNNRGYLYVNLYKDGKCKTYKVHRLVAQTWLPNPNNLPCINHISEIKTDNRVENLEWCTVKENNNWGTHNERVAKTKSKPVVALNKREQIVHVFPSAKEAGRNGYDQGTVAACCLGKRKTHKGLVWYYQDDFLKKVC